MLCDRYLDELVETFEAGFAATNGEPVIADAMVRADEVRFTAWLDGACYSDPTIADSFVSYQHADRSVLTFH
jgi:hypothetical protein